MVLQYRIVNSRDYWYNINQIFTKFINKNTVRLSQTEINELNSYRT